MSKIIVSDSIANRIKTAMSLRGLRAVDIVERTGIPKGSISQYMTGYVEPKTDRIYLIAKALSVDPVWLMGMDVPMEKKFADANKLADITLDAELVDYAWKVLQMDDTQKKIIYGMIDQMTK